MIFTIVLLFNLWIFINYIFANIIFHFYVLFYNCAIRFIIFFIAYLNIYIALVYHLMIFFGLCIDSERKLIKLSTK